MISTLDPNEALISSPLTLLLRGKNLGNTNAVKIQNSQTGQSISGTLFNIAANTISAQFNLQAIAGLFDLVLTTNGLEYVFKTVFTVLAPPYGPVRWQVTKLSKTGNFNTKGSIVVADVDRQNDAEIYVAAGGRMLSRIKKTLESTWLVTNFLDKAGEDFRHLLVFDGNRDGELELYAASSTPNCYQYEWGKLPPDTPLSLGGNPMVAADGNHDGMLEVYLASGDTESGQGLAQWSYNGTSWTNSELIAASPGIVFTSLAAGDGDNDPDHLEEIYVAYQDSLSNVFLYQYKFNGSSWTGTGLTNPGSGAIQHMTLADLDRNGQSELYIASSEGRIYQMQCTFPTAWGSNPINPAGSIVCNQIVVGDGDNDGRNEIYGAGQDGHAWQFRWSSSWELPVDLGSAGTTLTAITVGDGDNSFQNEVYALGADGFVYQFQEMAPLPTATSSPTATATPLPLIADFGGELIDAKYVYVAPNPTKGERVNFRFYLKRQAEVQIRIFTPRGNLVMTQDYQVYAQGWNSTVWNAAGMVNGVYFYIVEAKSDGVKEKLGVKKIALIR